MKKSYIVIVLLAFLFCLSPNAAVRVFAQQTSQQEKNSIREKALDLVRQNRYLDAFPLLEKVAPLFPEDKEVWAHYGIAILARSSTLAASGERKSERVKGYNVLMKAKQLGTDNVVALNLLDQLPEDGGEDDNFGGSPEFEKNLREGEAFFGRGEYDKAFAAYEKAYKINPKSYEAALFLGDSLYASEKYKESETWFAKAVEIEPNREQAYRFWGDALMNQKKTLEARDKFVEAFIAEPFSRMPIDRIGRWIGETQTKAASVTIIPPGNEPTGDVTIDEKLLKVDDGTIAWKVFNETRKAQIIAAGGSADSLSNVAAAYRKVADAFRTNLKTGKVKYPDQSLTNLVKLDDAGLLEPYLFFTRPSENIIESYNEYRAKNRDKLKRFFIEYMLGLSK